MSERVIRRTPANDKIYEEDSVVDRPVADSPINVVSRVVWLVAGVIILLLAFRFVLSALAANPANAFVNFIYNASHPFVAPFFGIFHYNNIYLQGSGSHLEVYTLVAMAVYAALAWVITAALNIGRRY